MNKIKELRSLLGVTQAKFSELTKIPRRTIEDWERDKMSPPPYVIELLEFYVNEKLLKESQH